MSERDFQKVYVSTYQNYAEHVKKLLEFLDDNDKTDEVIAIVRFAEKTLQKCQTDRDFAKRWREYIAEFP